MTAIAFTVAGTPAPQGSKRPVGRTSAGHAILVEDSRRVKPWRALVTAAAADLPRLAGSGPLRLDATFRFARPAVHFLPANRRRSAPELRAGAPVYHATAPDLSKLIRALEDALTDAGLWPDDRLVAVETGRKLWCGPDERPGADVLVAEL